MKKLLLSVAFSVLLSACGGVESDAKKIVLGSLKDPDSAKFGKFTQINEDGACLTVNARNSMGGYTGDQQAMLIKSEGKWAVVDIDAISHNTCIDIISKLKKGNEEEIVKPMDEIATVEAKPDAGGVVDGKNVYEGLCQACHGTGAAGAPRVGDKGAWGPRVAQGKGTLFKHALSGFTGKSGTMPAKGGNPALSDAEVKAAVEHMIGLLK